MCKGSTGRLTFWRRWRRSCMFRKAFNVLIRTLERMSQGSGGTLTTQQVADRLNVSRPFVVKLLESGVIDHLKVGKHRRVKLSDLLAYEKSL